MRIPPLIAASNTPVLALVLVLVLVLVLASLASAAGVLQPSNGLAALDAVREEVRATVRDGLATTRVTEVFRNQHDRALEAVYTFTLPRGASVTDFRMWVAGRELRADVLDRDEARRTYESLVRRARDPGLLEQTGDRTFQARVFPIEPGSEQRFEVEYFERLSCEGNVLRYLLPIERGGARMLAMQLDVRSAVPLGAIECPGRKFDVVRDAPGHAVIGWEGQAQAGAFEARISLARPKTGMDLIVHRPVAAEPGYFLLAITPAELAAEGPVLPKDVTLVIDTSGSMSGAKIEQARAALVAAIAALRPEDSFNIIRFSSAVEPWRPSPVTASAEARAEATAFARSLDAAGSTALHDALAQALSHAAAPGRPHVVLFITDGMPTIGETDPAAILALARAGGARGVRVFTFGVGDDVDARLLEGIAGATRGVAETVAVGEAIDWKVAALCRKIDAPILTDLELDLASLSAFDVSPRTLPDLFAGTQLVVTGRTKAAGPVTVRLRGTGRGGRPVEIVETVEVSAQRAEDAEIGRLFTMRKVAALLDRDARTPLPREVRDEVVALAKRFRLATPLTLFFIPEPKPVAPEVGGLPNLEHPAAEHSDHNETAEAVDGMQGMSFHNRTEESIDGMQGTPISDPVGESFMGGGGGGGVASRAVTGSGGRHDNVARGSGITAGKVPTESAAIPGLRWLARHQSPDGSWRPDATLAACTGTACPGAGAPGLEVEATSLALLAFLGAGETHLSRRTYEDPVTQARVRTGEVVKRAINWLRAAQRDDGGFGAREEVGLKDALGSLALSEAYGLTAAMPLRAPAEAAIASLARAIAAAPTVSASLASWTLAALRSAEVAGLTMSPEVAAVRARLASRSSSSLLDDGEALAFLEGLPARTLDMSDATLPALAKRLLAQERTRISRCTDGSFDGDARLAGRDGGRVIATAAAVLVLEHFYRYDTVFLGESRR